MTSARKRLVGAVGLALVATPLSIVATATSAHAAPVTIRLLNLNDFHGRIDNNTTKFATTVEQARLAAGEANTLLLSAGDNIGASLFASAVQDDKPTIDVLNALDLATSSVGNHEFDKGMSDLTGRVAAVAEFDYLGANVYHAGTTAPALPAYDTFTVGGLTVGVIGAVTSETPTLVSPAGVSGLAFGDPVAAVNRVAAQLSDGDDSNGEADVLVAEYHEGASAGTPDGSSLAAEQAAGGIFARIVDETHAEVDAIFTGHTHKEYAWDTGTRPVVQTGSYGAFLGQVDLTVESTTGEVTSYTQSNVARAAAEDLSLPRVAAVKAITDAALAHAAEVGNRPVGRITADITTALPDPSAPPTVTGTGNRDNRAAESTLGGVVADALLAGGEQINADVDLGLTNSGGLRSELLYAGDTTSNPLNTDGVVTFAEANNVLPFNNTVALVTLTGAQLKAVLEQQWQPAGTSRPYAQLGMSDNVEVVADATQPVGKRILQVRIDGKLIDPAATYVVSTLSFLATGGDNFSAFKQGTYVDTGLLDAQLWRDFLASEEPVKPDYARRQVFTNGLAAGIPAGATTPVVLGPDAVAPVQPFTGETLDLTSARAVKNTSVEVTGTKANGTTVALGTHPVTAGSARLDLAVPGSLSGGNVRFVAQPSGTSVTLPVRFGKSPATVVAKVRQKRIVADRTRTRIRVRVGALAEQATGRVKVVAGGRTYRAKLEDGVAVVTLRPFEVRGAKRIRVTYVGNATTQPESTVLRVRVRR